MEAGVRITHSLPGWELPTERLKRPVTIGIVGILGKDGRDELVQRRQRVSPSGLFVELQQAEMHIAGKPGHFHQQPASAIIVISALIILF